MSILKQKRPVRALAIASFISLGWVNVQAEGLTPALEAQFEEIKKLTPETDAEIKTLSAESVEKRLNLSKQALEELVKSSPELSSIEVSRGMIEMQERALDEQLAKLKKETSLSVGQISEEFTRIETHRNLLAKMKLNEVTLPEQELNANPSLQETLQKVAELKFRIQADEFALQVKQTK